MVLVIGGGGAVVVTLERVPVKDRPWVCGIPRWLVSTATVWAAANWPFSMKLNVSPELQFSGEQAESEYAPPLVNPEPTTTPLSTAVTFRPSGAGEPFKVTLPVYNIGNGGGL